MHSEIFQPVDFKTLRNSVTSTVRDAILNGVLLPGEQVNQAQIAARLGISRGPVREALRQLEEEGLVHSLPHKGTFVTDITPAYIEEIYGIRRVLEVFAIRRTIKYADKRDLIEFRTILTEMQSAAERGDTGTLRELDLQFHTTICKSARHAVLMQLWKSIEVGVRRVVALRHGSYKDPHDILGTHPDILGAIETRDVEGACELLDRHIKDAGELVYLAWQTPAVTDQSG